MHKCLMLPMLFAVTMLSAQGNRSFGIQFNNFFDASTPLVLTLNNYTTMDGASINFSTANYYVSNIRLVPTTGNEVVLDTVLLIRENTVSNIFEIGQIPVGVYQNIKFDIGLDSARNHGDPTTYSGNHPLAYTSMFWSWNSGYIFFKIEGEVDTTSSQNGSLIPFEYHVGTDALAKTVTMPINLEVTSNTESILADIDFRIATLLDGLEFKGSSPDLSTHTFDNMALATALVDNLQPSFSIEVTKQDVTGINDLDTSNWLTLSPNPMQTTTVLQVNAPDVSEVEVFDLMGKKIFAQTIENSSATIYRSQFPASGIYLVKVWGEGPIKKLVVQ